MPLDRLSTTIGDLKASLSTIRQGLEALRGGPGGPSAADRLCASPAAGREIAADQLERLRADIGAERAGWQRSAAASAGELASLRQRLADAGVDAARLHGERATLVSRIAELEQALGQAGTGEVVAASVRPSSALAIEPAAAAELGAGLDAPGPVRTIGATAADASDRDADLQLRAALALAQLKIADLTAELRSARAGREAVEAEIRSLRSLTDARIKRFMGWR